MHGVGLGQQDTSILTNSALQPLDWERPPLPLEAEPPPSPWKETLAGEVTGTTKFSINIDGVKYLFKQQQQQQPQQQQH